VTDRSVRDFEDVEEIELENVGDDEIIKNDSFYGGDELIDDV
jgi:hypothetical protein